MGVNFPDVRFIVNWGPARSILDQHQEAGRAGRDGKKSHVIIIYHGQQVGHCEPEVKDFVRAKGCFQIAAYKTLDSSIQPLEPLHDCCSFCSELCKCGGENCSATSLPFEVGEQAVENPSETNGHIRQVTCQDRNVLKEALYEVLNAMSSEAPALDGSSSHGFSTQLIDDIIRNYESIFTLEDLLTGYRVVYKFLSSRSFVKSRRLWVRRTHTMGFSPSFVGGSGGMLPRKIFENWNAGKRISWHFGP